MNEKSKKIVLLIVLTLILAGIGVGIFFLIKSFTKRGSATSTPASKKKKKKHTETPKPKPSSDCGAIPSSYDPCNQTAGNAPSMLTCSNGTWQPSVSSSCDQFQTFVQSQYKSDFYSKCLNSNYCAGSSYCNNNVIQCIPRTSCNSHGNMNKDNTGCDCDVNYYGEKCEYNLASTANFVKYRFGYVFKDLNNKSTAVPYTIQNLTYDSTKNVYNFSLNFISTVYTGVLDSQNNLTLTTGNVSCKADYTKTVPTWSNGIKPIPIVCSDNTTVYLVPYKTFFDTNTWRFNNMPVRVQNVDTTKKTFDLSFFTQNKIVNCSIDSNNNITYNFGGVGSCQSSIPDVNNSYNLTGCQGSVTSGSFTPGDLTK